MAGVEAAEKADQLHGGMQSRLFPELQIWSIQENPNISPQSLVNQFKISSYCNIILDH
jgi:hypothetical protein